MDNATQLRATLDPLEEQRRAAVHKPSQTQQQVIAAIPCQHTRVMVVLQQIHMQVLALRVVRAKERSVRWHALDYVGLTQRQQDLQHTW